MKIGLMADTHDRLEAIIDAVNFFNRQGVEHVLHAGDLISAFTSSKFAGLRARLYIVWGNNDGDKERLRSKFEEIGARVLGDFASIELGGRRIALMHGTDQGIVEAVAGCGIYDIVVRGHTHEATIREGRTPIVNPGEVCGYLSGRGTVAMLDLDELRAEIFEL